MRNYYEILGITKEATADQIKQAYYALAKMHHPDKAVGSKVKFQEIQLAYNVLIDPEKRKQYDSGNIAEQCADGVQVPDLNEIFNMVEKHIDLYGAYVLRASEWSISSKNDTYQVKLEYTRNISSKKCELLLPVFSEPEQDHLNAITLYKNPKNIFQRIFSYIYPYVSLMAFSLVMTGLFSYGVLFAAALFAIFASCYSIIGKLLRSYMSSKLETVEGIIEKRLIERKDMSNAHSILYSSTLNWTLVLLKFFNSIDLEWKYFYLKGCLLEKWKQFDRALESYKEALKLSTTDDERFLCIKGLINVYLSPVFQHVYRYNGCCAKEINELMSQIPLDSFVHIKELNDLREKLYSCLQSLADKKAAEAYDKLNEIEINEFGKRLYVYEIIIFYQLKAALILIGGYEGYGDRSLDFETRLRTARDYLAIVKNYVSEYYPNKLQMAEDCLDSCEALIKELSFDNMRQKPTTLLLSYLDSQNRNEFIADRNEELLSADNEYLDTPLERRRSLSMQSI